MKKEKRKQISHINLHSCLGGMALGFERVNPDIKTVLMYEPNSACRNVIEHFWEMPAMANTQELMEGLKNVQNADIVSARYRKKNWSVTRDVIAKVRPKIVVIEGMASMRSRGVVQILQDLWALDYDGEGHIISACSFGAVYKGERFWLIAHTNSDGRAENRKSSETQGGVGEQYITDKLLNEFRVWLERDGPPTGRTVFNQPRVLRRNDGLSRRVDATRVRLLSNDVSPLVAAFIGFCISNVLNGKFEPIPMKQMAAVDYVRNVTKKTNLVMNTERLVAEGVPFVKKNGGMHLIIQSSSKFIDYWPSTDVFIVRGTKDRGFGVENVLIRAAQIVADR